MRSMLWTAALLFLGGCTTYGAIYSPITDDSAVDLPDVVGTWTTEQPLDDSSPLFIDIVPWPYGDYEYDVTMRDTTEVFGELEVRVAEFGGTLVVAALPGENELKGTVLPLYQFYRLRPSAGDTLFVDALEPERLRELLGSEDDTSAALSLERGDPDILFLATASDLAEVFAAHADEEELWTNASDATVFVRVP